MLEPGGVIGGGRYRVGRVLGTGGMGSVVEAVHAQLGTRVAIKVLREERARRPDAVERFLREARAAAQLRGEHVCRVHDFGTLEDGTPYMVMELLEGRDLASILKQSGTLEPGLAARYTLQVCAAIAEAHALGIVHRDLKPSNLFVVERPDGAPSIKVLDFGIAKTESHDSKLTETDVVMGSPVYMSPEQLRSSKGVTAQSDIWSIGVVMYELVTGHPPFDGETPTDLAVNITTKRPAPLPASVPRPLADAIRRCLRREPSRRFSDVAALAAAIEPVATAAPAGARSVARVLASAKPGADDVVTAPAMPSKQPTHETTMRGASGEVATGTRSRPRSRLMLAAGAAAALACVAAVLVIRGRGAADTPPPAARASSAADAGSGGGLRPAEAVVPLDAAPAAVVPLDAATAVPPPTDAMPADAAAAAAVDAPAPRPDAPHRKPHRRPPRETGDLGKSRY